jgi:hypothetical protein
MMPSDAESGWNVPELPRLDSASGRVVDLFAGTANPTLKGRRIFADVVQHAAAASFLPSAENIGEIGRELCRRT